jgi:ABC-2 type transport system permease protein
MTSRRIRNILKKEWRVMFSDLSNGLLVTLLPFIVMGQGVLYIWLISRFGGDAIMSNSFIQTALEKLRAEIPLVSTLSPDRQLQTLLLSQFKLYILLVPTMIAISFATFSIVEEKLSRSLEPLLATPVKTWELLMGKALAGAIPALVMTWLCGMFFLLVITAMGWGELVKLVLTPSWYVSFFLLTPAITVLSFLLGVIGSSRARDAKGAQNLVVVIILPVFVIIGIQVTGIVWFSLLPSLTLALGLVLVDLVVLRIAVKLFQRESIVVKWQ